MRAKRDPRWANMRSNSGCKISQRVAVVGRFGISFSLGLLEACLKVVGYVADKSDRLKAKKRPNEALVSGEHKKFFLGIGAK